MAFKNLKGQIQFFYSFIFNVFPPFTSAMYVLHLVLIISAFTLGWAKSKNVISKVNFFGQLEAQNLLTA